MRFRLRTLMIVMAVAPPLLGWLLSTTVDGAFGIIEGYLTRFIILYVAGITAMIFWDWHRNRSVSLDRREITTHD